MLSRSFIAVLVTASMLAGVAIASPDVQIRDPEPDPDPEPATSALKTSSTSMKPVSATSTSKSTFLSSSTKTTTITTTVGKSTSTMTLTSSKSSSSSVAASSSKIVSSSVAASATKVTTSTAALTSSKATTSSPVLSSSKVSSVANTTSASATYSLPAASPSKTNVPSSMMRGVNVGGWLILEPWMNQILLNGSSAPDEITYDALSGSADNLQNHWSTYFTESDVAGIAGFGMNALRIPIGYWAFNNSGTPYVSGAQAYLDQAIGWARKYGMQVLLDVHGSPGSQNGWDHSGDVSQVAWQSGSNTTYLGPNMLQSIDILQQVATKYGTMDYADVIFAIEIVNEPINWAPNDFSVSKAWAASAYNAMMQVVTNPNLQIITHDNFMGPQAWYDLGSAINANLDSPKFAVDLHLYQNMQASDSSLTVEQHIQEACSWGNAATNDNLPFYVGEFSAATNVCVNPDGSSFGDDGSQSCTQDGCQCSSTVPINQWSPAMINTTRMFWEAQLESFEHNTAGYFLWSIHGFGGWSLVDLYNYGVVGPTLDDRMYGSQCNFTV